MFYEVGKVAGVFQRVIISIENFILQFQTSIISVRFQKFKEVAKYPYHRGLMH